MNPDMGTSSGCDESPLRARPRKKARKAGDHLRVITERGMKSDTIRDALESHGLRTERIVAGEPTLEDVFLSLAR